MTLEGSITAIRKCLHLLELEATSYEEHVMTKALKASKINSDRDDGLNNNTSRGRDVRDGSDRLVKGSKGDVRENDLRDGDGGARVVKGNKGDGGRPVGGKDGDSNVYQGKGHKDAPSSTAKAPTQSISSVSTVSMTKKIDPTNIAKLLSTSDRNNYNNNSSNSTSNAISESGITSVNTTNNINGDVIGRSKNNNNNISGGGSINNNNNNRHNGSNVSSSGGRSAVDHVGASSSGSVITRSTSAVKTVVVPTSNSTTSNSSNTSGNNLQSQSTTTESTTIAATAVTATSVVISDSGDDDGSKDQPNSSIIETTNGSQVDNRSLKHKAHLSNYHLGE